MEKRKKKERIGMEGIHSCIPLYCELLGRAGASPEFYAFRWYIIIIIIIIMYPLSNRRACPRVSRRYPESTTCSRALNKRKAAMNSFVVSRPLPARNILVQFSFHYSIKPIIPKFFSCACACGDGCTC